MICGDKAIFLILTQKLSLLCNCKTKLLINQSTFVFCILFPNILLISYDYILCFIEGCELVQLVQGSAGFLNAFAKILDSKQNFNVSSDSAIPKDCGFILLFWPGLWILFSDEVRVPGLSDRLKYFAF